MNVRFVRPETPGISRGGGDTLSVHPDRLPNSPPLSSTGAFPSVCVSPGSHRGWTGPTDLPPTAVRNCWRD